MHRGSIHTTVYSIVFFLLDIVLLSISIFIAVLLRVGRAELIIFIKDHFEGWIIFCGSVIMANYIAGFYSPLTTYSRFNMIVMWMFSMVFSVLVLSVVSFAWLKFLIGRGVLSKIIVLYGVTLFFTRDLLYRAIFRRGFFLCRYAIIGYNEYAKEVIRLLNRSNILPYHRLKKLIVLKGNFEIDKKIEENIKDFIAVIDTPEELLNLLKEEVDLCVVTLPYEGNENLYSVLSKLRFLGIEILIYSSFMEFYTGRIPLESVDDKILLDQYLSSRIPIYRNVKRLMDILISIVALLIFLPLILIISIVIKLSDLSSPVFYTQKRMGQFGNVFTIYKFRTMVTDAEKDTGPVWSFSEDARVTFIGRILRRFRLDEIPQFINVIKGDMSIVGPRPERPEIYEYLEKQIPLYSYRLNVPPGLTGWAQVKYKYTSILDEAKCRLEYDLYYIKNASIILDIQIILQTLRAMFLNVEVIE